jgi:predicted ABC-type exoprotein transport system permease subunit
VAFKIALSLRKKEKLTAGQFKVFINWAFVLSLFVFVAAGIYYYYPE